jgi:hypothetical protein
MRGFDTLWRRATPNVKTQAGASVEGEGYGDTSDL